MTEDPSDPAYRKPLHELSPEELSGRIVLAACELNVMLRAGSLYGLVMHVDVVDRDDALLPGNSYPEVHVRAGEDSYPVLERNEPFE